MRPSTRLYLGAISARRTRTSRTCLVLLLTLVMLAFGWIHLVFMNAIALSSREVQEAVAPTENIHNEQVTKSHSTSGDSSSPAMLGESPLLPPLQQDSVGQVVAPNWLASILVHSQIASVRSADIQVVPEDTATPTLPLGRSVGSEPGRTASDIAAVSATSKQPKSGSPAESNARPLNVVLFYTDDWNAKNLGIADKTGMVHTPNLDQLAAEGQYFPRSYVTTSVCWQSRATLLTGMYVSVHKFFRLKSRAFYGEVVRWTDTLFALLKGAGNHVGFVGKWHAPLPNQKENAQAFDFFRAYYGEHWTRRNGVVRHVTELNQADALEFLQNRPVGQNFALTVSFYATHAWNLKQYPDSYMPQPYTEKLYNSSVSIPLPSTATEDAWNNLPWFFTEKSQARVEWHDRGFDVEAHRQETMKRIYRMVTEVDDAVGAIIAELKAQGVYDDTLFIFTADNGSYQGEFGLAGKWYIHDESIRVPLIIRDPRMPDDRRGQVNENIALNIDLAPTILSAAGVEPPSAMQGRDLAQLYLTAENELSLLNWRQDFFYEWNKGSPLDADGHDDPLFNPAVFALVQKDWKYVFWPQTNHEQIFNLADASGEQFDVFNITYSANRATYNELKKRYSLLKLNSQAGFKM